MGRTLVTASGALLRARELAPGLVALEVVEPHRCRVWRAVRAADVGRHAAAWAAARGVTVTEQCDTVTPDVTPPPDETSRG